MATIAINLPKKKLVEIILDHLAESLIRRELHVDPATNLRTRLMSLSKASLARFFLEHRGGAKRILEQVEQAYPIRKAPTLFLVQVTGQPVLQELVTALEKLEQAGLKGRLWLGRDRAVRAVYVRAKARPVLRRPLVYEFQLAYEIRLTYTPADGPNRGRAVVVYALESALFWLPVAQTQYAVLACTDFEAVAPIQKFTQTKLGLEFICPYLSHATMRRITAKAKVRTATFKSLAIETSASLDVATLTLSDPRLEERELFSEVLHDPARDQTAGFYADHPDLKEAGLGVSRRYARIWTPTILDRDGLVRLSTGVIKKVETEIKRIKQQDLSAYIATLANLPVYVGRRRLAGGPRLLFEALVVAAWEAQRAEGKPEHPIAQLLPQALRHADALRLVFRAEMDCPDCGSVLAHCPECWSPQTPVLRGPGQGEVRLLCHPKCPGNGRPASRLVCLCDRVQEVLEPFQHLFAYPDEALVLAISEFSAKAGIAFDRVFVVADAHLKLLQEHPDSGLRPLRLKDLRAWSAIPGINPKLVRPALPPGVKKRLQRHLRRTKEKCFRGGGPPTRTKCEDCLAVEQTKQQFAAGELCLARLFGIPIGWGFDGIHHGHEKADIRYQDHLGASPKEENVFIHLKSHTTPGRKGAVGRGVHAIKGLYAQLFYLAFQVQTKQVKADVIGVSIPNLIAQEVKDSMRHLCARLGIRLLVIEEEEWTVIAESAWQRMPGPVKRLPAHKAPSGMRSGPRLGPGQGQAGGAEA